jgi:sterol desaturase/sphingolipid hydroxylase (fatty acid hydroxylase superfamily)
MEFIMNHPTTLIEIAAERAVPIFMFDMARYVIAAGLIAALVWALRRTAWASRKIQKREATWKDFRREFLASMRTVIVYTLVAIGVMWAIRHGWMRELEMSYSFGTDLLALGGILIAHDAYFYWAHRAMHHPKLFKSFHKFHHQTMTPTPWAAYSFALPEAFVMAMFMPIWMMLVPTPGWVVFTFLAVMILRNTMGHAGLELHARGWASHPVLKWISTTTHHDLHHCGSYSHNYGFYFTFWDKVMGTEHPDYVKVYDRVTAPSLQRPSTDAVPSPAQ